MKKNIFIVFVFMISVFYCSCDENEKLVQIDLNIDNSFYSLIEQTYKNLWIGFTKGNIDFESYGHYFTINTINYYYKNQNKLIFIGCIDKNGVYDKNKILIKKCPFDDKSKNLGLSSIMIEDPFSPVIVVKRNETIGMLDPYTRKRQMKHIFPLA